MSLTRIPAPTYVIEPEPKALTEEQREACLQAARLIDGAFTWADSAEGLQFWSGVERRLMALANGEPLK